MQDVPGDTGKFVGQRNGELVSVQPLIHPRRSSLIAGVKAHFSAMVVSPGSEFSPRSAGLGAACWRRMVDRPKWSTLWSLREQ